MHVCTVLFSVGLLFSSDKLTFELFARGHFFSMGGAGFILHSLSLTQGFKVHTGMCQWGIMSCFKAVVND